MGGRWWKNNISTAISFCLKKKPYKNIVPLVYVSLKFWGEGKSRVMEDGVNMTNFFDVCMFSEFDIYFFVMVLNKSTLPMYLVV